jgi:hypothetical protein
MVSLQLVVSHIAKAEVDPRVGDVVVIVSLNDDGVFTYTGDKKNIGSGAKGAKKVLDHIRKNSDETKKKRVVIYCNKYWVSNKGGIC